MHEAIGERLTCIFVDTGLLRLGEAEEVVRLFRGHYNIPLFARMPASFSSARSTGVTDPEQKRKIIGATFIDVFDDEAQQSAASISSRRARSIPTSSKSVSATGGPRVTIKSHHNVGGLPARMKLKLVEPLRELFKDEVRELGRELGLPEHFVERHPFPGPGPGDPHPRRGDAGDACRSSSAPTRSSSTKSARPGSTTRSGRPSRCCCR